MTAEVTTAGMSAVMRPAGLPSLVTTHSLFAFFKETSDKLSRWPWPASMYPIEYSLAPIARRIESDPVTPVLYRWLPEKGSAPSEGVGAVE